MISPHHSHPTNGVRRSDSKPRVWKGELETVIGCVGDIAYLDPGLIEALDVVETVQRITRIRSVL